MEGDARVRYLDVGSSDDGLAMRTRELVGKCDSIRDGKLEKKIALSVMKTSR